MKYDDASWHYGGNFPTDLPPAAGATHIGMFVSWCMLNGLAGKIHTEEFPELLAELKSRRLSPGAFLIKACDEKFTDEDLSDEGNAFTMAYFELQTGKYIHDYEKVLLPGWRRAWLYWRKYRHALGEALLPEGLSLYHVPDTWESFDKLAPIIFRRYQNWKQHGTVEGPPKPWWRFWS